MAEAEHTIERFGRCARAAWDHAVDAFTSGPTQRPGVTTAHLLLGVLKHDTCAGALILAKMGLDLQLAYKHTSFVLQYGRRQPERAESADWAGVPHTRGAGRAITFCFEEADFFSPTYPIGTEHITLAILRVPEGSGAQILRWCGIDEAGVRRTRDELWELLHSFED